MTSKKEAIDKGKNAFNSNEQKEGATMENTLKIYEQLSNKVKFRYGKEELNDKQKLDYAECLQEVITEIIESKIEVNNPKHYIKRAVKNRIKNRWRDESKIDLSDSNFEDEMYISPIQEVISAKEAIKKMLDTEQMKAIEMYGQGYTLKEVMQAIGATNEKEVLRILRKAYKKIEAIKMAFYFDSRYTSYQGKNGKVNVSYNENIKWNGKQYIKVNFNAESKVINRKYICLDQTREKRKSIKEKYDANTCPVIPKMEVTLWKSNYFQYLPESFQHTIEDNVYSNSQVEVSHNKEYMQICINEAIYQKQNKREVKREKREVFGNNHFISFQYGLTNI